MADIRPGRCTADLGAVGDEIVVFIIGMRINKPWKVRSWWPVFTAMPRMLRYLQRHPDKGLLGYHMAFSPHPGVVQYWRTFDHLERFARDPSDPHLEPWRRFNRLARESADVGIWHETYRVRTDSIETIYTGMPAYGLAAATASMPVRPGRSSAAVRIGARTLDEPAVPAPDA